MPPRHDPFLAIRERGFLFFATGRLSSTIAMTLLQATIAWHVYRISGSALQLGLIGLARFLPALGLSLVGGAFADSHDRKRIVQIAQVAPFACSVTLCITTLTGDVNLPLIYGLVLLIAVASAFENPARQALLPLIVSKEAFPNAIVVNSTVQSLGFVSGPALGGLLIWLNDSDPALAYGVHAGLLAASQLLLMLLRPRAPEGERSAVSISAIREGLEFVWHRQVLLGAMTLDMFAVVFGGASALLPIYALDILDVGSLGYGILTASLEAGALVTALGLVFLPPIQRAGRTLLATVALFGIGTIVFGLSRNFALSVAAYAFIGMADQVSVVMRHTLVQLSTPDELRGRVSSVSMLFIGTSNQLGAMESGFVAAATSATFAVVSGGLGCLAVVAAVAAKSPLLRTYITPTPIEVEDLLASSCPAAAEDILAGDASAGS